MSATRDRRASAVSIAVRLLIGVVLAAGLLLAVAARAEAHPLGNFTVNQYSGLDLSPDRIGVDYVLDMAEIPAFQTRQRMDTDHDGQVGDAEQDAWQAATCTTLIAGLDLRLDGRRLRPVVVSSGLGFPPGAGGLVTLRLECEAQAPVPGGPVRGPHTVEFANHDFDGRIGWREITARGDGATVLTSDVPDGSTSERLTSYPKDLLKSPLDQRHATVEFRPGGGPGSGVSARGGGARTGVPMGVDRATRAFTELVARQRLGIAFGLLAFALAVLLGAVHALAPGHGKTVMAAYLLGMRGSLLQSLLVALTVTLTHTAGVLVLGVALSASTALAPERIYPWLGLASGLMLAGVGVTLLRRALPTLPFRPAVPRLPAVRAQPVVAALSGIWPRRPPGRHVRGKAHRHNHGHDHPPHAPAAAPAAPPAPPGWRSLVSMGFAGGLVPSPSALVVLLGAIALHRAWFGVLLVVAYGAGMAGTLTGAGVALVRARAAIDRRALATAGAPGAARRRPGPAWFDRAVLSLSRALPLATAGVLLLVGLFLAARGAMGI
jgi:ABC-type nickel/cobalt efflux system permease component RcnA